MSAMDSEASEAPARPRVLVVEDEALVAEDLRITMESLGYEVVDVTDRGEEAVARATDLRPDVALLDIHLRGAMSGIDVAHHLRDVLDIPVVFVTAHSDAGTLRDAGEAEPFGYVVKPFQERELHATTAMAMYRHRAERRVREMEAWLSTMLGSIGDAVIATDNEGRVTLLNPTGELLTGWTRAEALGRPLSEVFVVSLEGQPDIVPDLFRRVNSTGVIFHLTQDYELRTRSGRRVPIDDSIAPIRDQDGTITGVVVVFRDRSEAKRALQERMALEKQMQESQRLESLGTLAGGIAHDFNNLLAVIMGCAALGQMEVSPESALATYLQEITDASTRAATLCRQMLAYTGKGALSTQPVDLSRIVEDTAALLQVSGGRNATLALDHQTGLPMVDADLGQIQQVIVNIVTNASEALEGRAGTVTITTRVHTLTAEEIARLQVGGELAPGPHVMLCVTDTGSGIPPEALNRIFDPFFTTKFIGRGLGLAATAGIVRAHGGGLGVESELGVGSEFRVYLPLSTMQAPQEPPPMTSEAALAWRATGDVLIADDDDAVRDFTERVLRRIGLTPTVAADGEAAVRAFESEPPGTFGVVLLDVTMPRLTGHEAVRLIRAWDGEVPIVMMSGYDESAARALFAESDISGFLEKPFSLERFATVMRRALEPET